MFIYSLKTTKKKMLSLIIILIVIIGAIIIITSVLNKAEETMYIETSKAIKVSTAAKTEKERLKFITSFGWEVEEQPTEINEVLIPANFDDVYLKYNMIQKTQGMDLLKYKSKKIKRYSYEIINYPDGEKDIRINLLIYKNKIIGGDVCSVKLDGFMHGFKFPSTPGTDELNRNNIEIKESFNENGEETKISSIILSPDEEDETDSLVEETFEETEVLEEINDEPVEGFEEEFTE